MGIIANGAQQGHVADNLDGTVGMHVESEENQFHFVLRICHNPINRMTKNNYGSHAIYGRR
ncbi:hypothetical protein T01_15972 [Trichinella spiralis]|uniref:Uncharacterized protein n=1 Tax=Trichinella spiralis TaxID=6334 RepID=A0A0V1B2S5_TRISP|nr:hypothetical protein T01_15972 [Trichinella spiralis]